MSTEQVPWKSFLESPIESFNLIIPNEYIEVCQRADSLLTPYIDPTLQLAGYMLPMPPQTLEYPKESHHSLSV